ncbi:uncharacterized protein LOC144108289 [Amblyomma americanum]
MCPLALGCTVLVCLGTAVVIFLIMPWSTSGPSAGALQGDNEGHGGGGGGGGDAGGKGSTKSGQGASAATARVPGKSKTGAHYAEYKKTPQTSSTQAAAKGKPTSTAQKAAMSSMKRKHGARGKSTRTGARARITSDTATGQHHNSSATVTAADSGAEATTAPPTATATINTTATKKPTTGKQTTTKKTNPTTETTTTTTAMPYNSLICTLGANMTMRAVSELPEDGLCDFSFYQALEEKHAILSGRGGPHVASFSLVLKAASQHAKTEYGLSFDYDFSNVTQKIIQQRETRKILTGLWRKKIYHYAFLSLRFYDLDKTKYRSVFHILQKVKDILHGSLVPQRPSYFLVGEAFSKEAWISWAFSNIRKRMHVAGAVVYGHLTYDDRGKGAVMPPSFWNSTNINQSMYEFNLDSAHAALKDLPTKNLGYTQFFLSVSLAGRYYKPLKEVGMLEDNGYVTTDPLFVSIAQYCNDTDYTWGFHNTTPIGAYYENVKAGRIITYDDVTSLQKKLCRGKQLIPTVKYGLAAYHADLDDPANTCGDGAYPRLRFLKKLLHFFNEKFLEAKNYDECLIL